MVLMGMVSPSLMSQSVFAEEYNDERTVTVEPDESVSLDFLEFLAEAENIDGKWVSAVEFDETAKVENEPIYHQCEQSSEKCMNSNGNKEEQ
ncbi:hypothetical protein OE749_03585 [Aestuariibacter sp. AA17]|uniref:Uncharacterized protein n=1 Tax=Fluctibacter corallii TaxID=2984329 RepID=A0ABT3A538_9ALTE|nr:hypothetical protein [Aestuariibacter sp. AA17]MCV2883784.1 hypothetical protein [Aestuariibacter sp. AA17]